MARVVLLLALLSARPRAASPGHTADTRLEVGVADAASTVWPCCAPGNTGVFASIIGAGTAGSFQIEFDREMQKPVIPHPLCCAQGARAQAALLCTGQEPIVRLGHRAADLCGAGDRPLRRARPAQPADLGGGIRGENLGGAQYHAVDDR